MLRELFPRFHGRILAQPILGPFLDGFSDWLLQHGHTKVATRRHIRSARLLEKCLAEAGIQNAEALTRSALRGCLPSYSQDDIGRAAVVSALDRYLLAEGRFTRDPLCPQEAKAIAYGDYLRKARGFAPSTIHQHTDTAVAFLDHLHYEGSPATLAQINATVIESFVKAAGQRMGRTSLQHSIAQVRGFLRYLALRGESSHGLDTQIDTPRVYRGECLPRSLPWDTVKAFLHSIDRSTPMGMRDFAMFLLIVTYGMRASEVVGLQLEDLEWRKERIRLFQRKTGANLFLPITDTVGTGLIDYLQHGRPNLTCREVFLRARAPEGILMPTAINEAFQAWGRRGGLGIPFQGPHCLRHSLAVHLLQQGASLKEIGDILGHRNAESTCVYIRLAVEDLRDVALPLPTRRQP